MSLQDLSLPVDVPWKLIATSTDMLASHKERFPHAMWKSSLAVFAYDPDLSDLPEQFPDRELSFLKVICSITSYAPSCVECPPPPDPKDYESVEFGYYNALRAWEREVAECQKIERRMYPCAGALIQVAVYPRAKGDETTDPAALAYFAAFEPKKRELIEVVTESGESLTQSKSNVNVRKGVTSTDSTEDLNVFTGANLKVGYAGAEVGGGVSGQWGTVKKSGTEGVNVTNSDASREAREGSSHTTSMSQLYHLLNSYHLGTNRAIFFLQPRPHTVQQKNLFTFIDGPQEIEGVQEFFLVVSRPKGRTIEDYCVDALLYTGHLDGDALQAIVLEPKTAETPWQNLWLGYATPKTKQDWPSAADLVLGAEILLGIPLGSDPATLAASDIGVTARNKFQEWGINTWLYNGDPPVTGQATVLEPPTIQPLTRIIPCASGWRIDRTRGLGGYDLWENPDSMSFDPLGNSPSKSPPQAFIDILSTGDVNDPATYRPDSALQVTVYVWPTGSNQGGKAFYHGRIKVYFIRDEAPDSARTVPMFVTARGVSSCTDSPFFEYAPDTALKLPPDLVAEARVTPPNIPPWVERPAELAAPPTVAMDAGQTFVPAQLRQRSSPPSGLSQAAIGAARAKIANAVSTQVRSQLVSALSCLKEPRPRPFGFGFSDYFFDRVAKVVLGAELAALAKRPEPEPQITASLVRYVAAHPQLASALGAEHNQPVVSAASVATQLRMLAQRASKAPGRATSTKRGPGALAPNPSFPALTLARLPPAHLERLAQIGVHSILDLVGAPASEVAARSGIDVNELRDLRLRALGFQPRPPTP